MSKKNKIKKLFDNEKQLINMLIKTNCCTLDQALMFVNRNRLKQLDDSGVVDIKAGAYGRVVKITNVGQKLGDYSKGVYKGGSTKHDLGLANEYLKLTDEQKAGVWAGNTWSKERGHSPYNTPDMVVEIEQENTIEVTYIEIVTKNYTKDAIMEKEIHAMNTNSRIKLIRV